MNKNEKAASDARHRKLDMISKLESGWTLSQIARHYGISRGRASSLIKGEIKRQAEGYKYKKWTTPGDPTDFDEDIKSMKTMFQKFNEHPGLVCEKLKWASSRIGFLQTTRRAFEFGGPCPEERVLTKWIELNS